MQGEQFVRKVKARAAELGIPMSDLYRDCKITSGTMSQWKKGLTNPRFTNIIKLAEYLKTTPEYLFGKTKEVETETPATEDMAEVLQAFRERPEMKMLFDAGLKANPETVRETARFLEGLAGIGKTD